MENASRLLPQLWWIHRRNVIRRIFYSLPTLWWDQLKEVKMKTKELNDELYNTYDNDWSQYEKDESKKSRKGYEEPELNTEDENDWEDTDEDKW
jgi:hypothetical protein